jgi:23S rRNA pseudouridine1911/1915/1917 synthase
MERERYSFKIADGDSGKRLDKFLVERLSKEFSRAHIQKLVTDGHVIIDNRPAKNSHRLLSGQTVDVTIPAPVASFMEPEEIPIDIVYEDGELLVVNKSADMVVHPAPGNYTGTLVNALLGHCKKLSGIGGVSKPGIVHRIDKGTSGLLVVAKTDIAHKSLAKQFKDKTIRRVYVALVKGVVELDNGMVELPIGRSRKDRKKMAVKFEDSRDAVTGYRVIERFRDSTLLELVLGTGRTHQIRVHMSYIGHPLIGDEKYGHRDEISRPALHAKTIGFIHPKTKEYMEFTTQLPPDMVKLIKRLRG